MSERPASWEHFSHDADVGLIGIGPTNAGAFRQAAIALTAVVTDPERVRTDASVSLLCHAASDELLLVEWLNALVFEMAVRSMLFGDFSVDIVGCEFGQRRWASESIACGASPPSKSREQR